MLKARGSFGSDPPDFCVEEEKAWRCFHAPFPKDPDDARITRSGYLDYREEIIRESRAPLSEESRSLLSRSRGALEQMILGYREELHSDKLDYPQSSTRKERPCTGTGKPNSISAHDWGSMSLAARRVYINADREAELKKVHGGDDPAVSAWMLINSTLSATMIEHGGKAIRVHKESFDILKRGDIDRLLKTIRENPGCDLWSCIPCAPWSTWQYVKPI